MISYSKCLTIDPLSIDACYNLATILHETKRYEEAEKFYRKTISVKSDHQLAYYNLGHMYYDEKRYKESIQSFLRAVELDSSDIGDSHIKFSYLTNCYIYIYIYIYPLVTFNLQKMHSSILGWPIKYMGKNTKLLSHITKR